MIPLVWDEMEAMLFRSLEHSHGMLTAEQLRAYLMDGSAVAFATVREGRLVMILVVMRVTYATYKAARIVACAGRELAGAMKFIDALEAWALTEGCVEIEAWCRPAMVRLVRHWGFQHKTTIVARDLRRKLQ